MNDSVDFDAIWTEFFPRLVGLVRSRLGNGQSRVRNEEDIAMSALHSFYRRYDSVDRSALDSLDDLWRILSRIAYNKLCSHLRNESAEKRGGGNVRGDSAMTLTAIENASLKDFLSNGHTEKFADSLDLTCREMIDVLPREILRQVARRRLEGYTNAEIADELNVVERTVQNKLRLIRKIWTEAGLESNR